MFHDCTTQAHDYPAKINSARLFIGLILKDEFINQITVTMPNQRRDSGNYVRYSCVSFKFFFIFKS